MAAKSSNLGDKHLKLTFRGQVEKPVQGASDQQEMEEQDSSPHNSLMWSPVHRLPLGSLNKKHCLEIQVTLADELGMCPHLHMLGWHQWWRICYEKPEVDLLRQ